MTECLYYADCNRRVCVISQFELEFDRLPC